MLSVVNMLLKREVGSRELNSHGPYIVDHGKSWKYHGIVFLSFCGNPVKKELSSTKTYQHNLLGERCVADSLQCRIAAKFGVLVDEYYDNDKIAK